ncbi:MAG: histidine kinase N-terminal 7TM domain-containing protein [Candidatus Izemoplasmataceae bacterium]
MSALFYLINSYIFLTIILMFYILTYALPKSSPLIKLIGLLTALSLIYVLGYLIELNAGTLELKYFWNYVQYLAIPFLPAIWLLIALYHRYDRMIDKKWMIVIFIIPVFTMMMRFTNNSHHFYYSSYTLINYFNFDFMLLNFGWAYHVYSIYLVFVIIYANMLYLSSYLKRKGLLKQTAKKLFLVSLFPLIGHIFNVLMVDFFPIDYVVLVSPLSIVLIAFILRDDYFTSIKPLARNQVFLQSETGTIIFNQLFEVIDFNPKAQAILKNIPLKGVSLTEINAMYPRFAFDDLQGENTFESNKKIYQIKVSSVTTHSDETIGYVMRLTDISATMQIINALKEREARIKTLVYYDQLTNLYNRHFLDSYLPQLKPFMHPMIFIFIDMNELKYVNDNFGHQRGDELLVNLATVMLKTIPNDAKAIRLGGDEFLIICPNKDEHFAVKFIEDFKQETSHYKHLSIAMGYSIKTLNKHFNQAYKEAEDAMYQDKEGMKKKSNE